MSPRACGTTRSPPRHRRCAGRITSRRVRTGQSRSSSDKVIRAIMSQSASSRRLTWRGHTDAGGHPNIPLDRRPASTRYACRPAVRARCRPDVHLLSQAPRSRRSRPSTAAPVSPTPHIPYRAPDTSVERDPERRLRNADLCGRDSDGPLARHGTAGAASRSARSSSAMLSRWPHCARSSRGHLWALSSAGDGAGRGCSGGCPRGRIPARWCSAAAMQRLTIARSYVGLGSSGRVEEVSQRSR